MKQCTKCKTYKELSEFVLRKGSKDGYHYTCKTCTKNISIEYRSRKNIKDLVLKKLYNTTKKELDLLYEQQEGKCRICGVFKSYFNKSGGLYVDHCHTTNKVRGLLCNSCNVMLGLSKDNLAILASAMNYLKETK